MHLSDRDDEETESVPSLLNFVLVFHVGLVSMATGQSVGVCLLGNVAAIR